MTTANGKTETRSESIVLLERIAIAVEALVAHTKTAPAAARTVAVRTDGLPTTLPNYGKSKGAPIAGASAGDLAYYGNGCIRTLQDAGKQKFHASETKMLAAINEEIRKQGGDVLAVPRTEADDFGPPPPGANGAPGPSDEDIPF